MDSGSGSLGFLIARYATNKAPKKDRFGFNLNPPKS
jgi:hypothetical protein